MKDNTPTKVIFISLLFMALLTTNVFANASLSTNITDQVKVSMQQGMHYYTYDSNKVVIFYDYKESLAVSTAKSLTSSLNLFTPNAIGIPIGSLDVIEPILMKNNYKAAILVFPSSPSGMKITSLSGSVSEYSWKTVAKFIENKRDQFKGTNFIFAMGNTMQLVSHISNVERIYASNEEAVESEHIYVYTLWTLADIFESDDDAQYRALGKDLRKATLKYFANNFNRIAASSISPQNPMGKESDATVEARKKKFFDDHQPVVVKQARPGYIIDPKTNREVDPATGKPTTDYGIDIFPQNTSTVTDFILQLLPIGSGLRGPVGGIVDNLLSYLFNEIGGAIGLSNDTVTQIFDVITQIPDLIASFSNPSASAIKALVEKLKPMLPIGEEFYPYINLFIDGLFLLRGSKDDIVNFIQQAVSLLIPDSLSIGSISVKALLSQLTTLGASVFDKIQQGGNVLDIIFSVLNEQIVANLTATVMGNGTVFGLSAPELTKFINKTTTTINFVIQYLSSKSLKDLAFEYGDKLLRFAFSEFGLSENTSETIILSLTTVLTAMGVINDPDVNLENQITEILKRVTNLNIDLIKEKAKDILKVISDASEGKFTSISNLNTNLQPILDTLGISTNIKNSLRDLIEIIATISSSNLSFSSVKKVSLMIADFATSLGLNSQYKTFVGQLFESLTRIINFVKNPPKLSDLLNLNFGGVIDIYHEIKNLFDLVVNFVKGVLPPAPTTTNSVSPQATGLSNLANNLFANASEIIGVVFQVVNSVQGNSMEGVMLALLQSSTQILGSFLPVDNIQPIVEVTKYLFSTIAGLNTTISVDQLISQILPLFPSSLQSGVKTVLDIIFSIKDVFTNGLQTLINRLLEWISGKIFGLIDQLLGALNPSVDSSGISINFDVPIGIGSFSLFTMKFRLGLSFGFEFDNDAFATFISDIIFRGAKVLQGLDVGGVFKKLFSFMSITPIFEAGFELSTFGSGSQSFLNYMLAALGVELNFSGEGWFKLLLFSFKNGVFSLDNFFKVIEWGFKFTIGISRTFTLLDFLTGGAGGSLNSIGQYIGLDAISITIAFILTLSIVKRAATANKPETGSMTITIGINFTVSLGIDITIARLLLKGTLEVTLTLLQDLVAPTPLQVYIAIQLVITVTIGFLFFNWNFDFKWSPDGFAPPLGKNISGNSPQDAVKKGALGGDTDNDGLSDQYENSTSGLKFNSPDSDGDGLTDKFETQTLKTDPSKKDTDGDGLDDNVEYSLKTNPLKADSDYDQVSDYKETTIYGTNPLSADTDQDGLDDYYEINHAWNITGVTTSVSQIKIGGKFYDDHTDPLNPDTDGDGLLDGQEGERGVYYGPQLTGTAKDYGYTPDPPLIFNGGYTHPLDNDTDDDSYWQLYDGSIAPVSSPYIMNLNDYVETHGLEVVLIDPLTGEPEAPRLIRTNPVNPDSDGDTGVTASQRKVPPPGFFLNSDGYELGIAHTDPLNGDTDQDGLIDGLEGILRPDSNHTDPLNPDTDGDGLGDMQETLLGLNPRGIDTDHDGVTDSDEFFKYGTNPFLNDTDFDGLEDGEELFLYHSNPFMSDSDADGLSDYAEVWKYFSSPSDEDSDNDGLTDYEEVMIHYTDPFVADTDGDGLLDGDEVLGLPFTDSLNRTHLVFTDPTKWDTDGDSLTTLDQYGKMSMPMSDGQEFAMGTDPSRRDTDLDGIEDGWELWLGKGIIPGMDPIKLDPLNNDTDGDDLLDGQEVAIMNMSTLLNPYIGFTLVRPYNTSATNPDTDGDQIPDHVELLNGTRPDNPDSDNDTLTDYEEINVYKTDPTRNDTDGDGLLDQEEVFGYQFPSNTSSAITLHALIRTDANNPDSDFDLLPDGAEVHFYNTDPRNGDVNGNGIVDGMEIDTDGDGLYDGEEFMVYKTVQSPDGGGVLNPDSDHDGLFDGFEVYQTLTNASRWDSDNDTYSDGLEFYCNTNPLDNSTTQSEINACFTGLDKVVILSPAPTKYRTNSIPVIVFDATKNMTAMSYQFRAHNGTWSGSVPMTPSVGKPGQWEGAALGIPLKNGTYEVKVTIQRPDGTTFERKRLFSLLLGPTLIQVQTPESRRYDFNEFTTPSLPIKVKAGLDFNSTWYRMRMENGTIMKDNTTLQYDSGLSAYYQDKFEFPKLRGTHNYTIEVFGMKTNGQVYVSVVNFQIKTPTIIENVAIVGTGVAATIGVGGGTIIGVRKGIFKNPFKKRS